MTDTVDDGTRAPETRLGALNRSLLDLASALTLVDNEQNGLLPDCRAVLRQTLVADVLAERHMVAIAGSQGTGKTTLVRNLYQIDREWMLTGRGQGERLPVFVMESSAAADGPIGRVTRLAQAEDGGSRNWVTEEVTGPDAWKAALRDDDGDTLLTELLVAPRLFTGADDGRAGVLLLPGYEPESKVNGLWQQLMRQALAGSARVLLVTHNQDLAAGADNKALDDLRAQYLKGVLPLVAVTHCEGIAGDEQKQDELRATGAQRFGVPAGNVFCTWSLGVTEAPLAALGKAVSTLSATAGTSRAVHLNRLESVLRTDLGRVLDRAEGALRARPGADGGQGQDSTRIQTGFEEAEAQIRIEYERQLTRRMKILRDDAIRRVRGAHLYEVEGWGNLGKRLVNSISLRGGRNRDDFEQRVLRCWTDGSPSESPVTAVHPEILAEVVNAHFTRLALNTRYDWRTGGGEVDAADAAAKLPVTVVRDVRRIAMLDRDMALGPADESERAARLMPALILEWAHVGTLFPQMVGLQPGSLAADQSFDVEEQAAEFTRRMGAWVPIQQEMVGVWAGLAGVPEANTVRGLLTAARGGAGGAFARSVASVVAGTVAVGITAVVTVDMINKGLTANHAAAETAIDAIFHTELANRMEAYDGLMTMSREMLATKVRLAYHLDAESTFEERLRWALHSVRAQRLGLLAVINGRIGAVG